MWLGFVVVALCMADVLTTEYVIGSGIGYESNEILAPVIGYPIYAVKLVFAILTVLAIEKVADVRLKFASYSTLLSFYILVVINNTLVILWNTDLNLDLGRLFAIFAAIFVVNMFVLFPRSSNSANA
ncbi:DUF5658 family protein [Archaeoglobus neptunius]|uniref:DUF5658 family protein n=1 Tax=Archaeoglobus neptunius TaxID=2798580 RepID=UPI001928A7A5|nr:DUF5658 family protein [Archaeoglobus neptunius]